MKKPFIKYAIGGILLLLLGSGLYLTFVLSKPPESSGIAATNTKAAPVTYSKTVNVNSNPSLIPTKPVILPTTDVLVASPSPTVVAQISPTVASSLFVTSIPSPTVPAATSSAISSLPITGVAIYSFIFVGFAITLIAISFIF